MDNGERIYLGIMETKTMQKLEEENHPPQEEVWRWENNKYKLSSLVADMVSADPEV